MSTAIGLHEEKAANDEAKEESAEELDPSVPIDEADPDALEAAAPEPESEKKAEAGLKKLVDPADNADAPAEEPAAEPDQGSGGGGEADGGFPR